MHTQTINVTDILQLCNRTFLEMFKRHGYDRLSKTQFYTDNYTRVYFEDRDHFREKVSFNIVYFTVYSSG